MNVGNVNTYRNQFILSQKMKLDIVVGVKLEIWKAKKNAINLKYVMKYNFYLEKEINYGV